MYLFFVGCDVSKHFFDVSYYEGKPKYLGQFANDVAGFEQMFKELKRITPHPGASWLICFENTGVYSKALLEWGISKQIPCKEENALKISKSLGIKRGHNDKADSKAICGYAFEKRDSLKPTRLASPLITKLKKLLSRRNLMVKQKHALTISLKDQKPVIDPDIYQMLESHNQQLCDLYIAQIKELEKQIEQIMEQENEVYQNYGLAKSVVGVGPIIATYLIATTENFTCFPTARKFASYCGIAPFLHNQSGTRKGVNKVSHMANKKMKSILSMGVNAAVRFDKEINLYYNQKLAEGKEKGTVINAVKNKLVQRIFAVVKRKSPYVRLMQYA